MGKIMNKVKGGAIILVSVAAGALGIEGGMLAGAALYDDIRFLAGKAPKKMSFDGKHLTAEDRYTHEKSYVHYNKKTDTYDSNFFQPKGYVKF